MEEKIMTLHPQDKQGVRISKHKYGTMRHAILASLRFHEEMTFAELTEDVRKNLEGSFDGSINWYVTVVKLDLEARGEIERIQGKPPQRLRPAARL